MSSYILRNLEEHGQLWENFKIRAAKDGHGMKWVILQLIRYYVAKGLPK